MAHLHIDAPFFALLFDTSAAEHPSGVARIARSARATTGDGPKFAGLLLDQCAHLAKVARDYSRPLQPSDTASVFRRRKTRPERF